jgi:hypothetical protein
MDILELYSENIKSFDFSQFVESQKKDIVLHCSTLDIQDGEWSKLKTEWVTLLKEFQENHSDVKVYKFIFKKKIDLDLLNVYIDYF